MRKYIIPIIIAIVILLVLGLVFAPNIMQSTNAVKTYENSTLGVSFNYPANWEIAPYLKGRDIEGSYHIHMGDPNERKYNFTDPEAQDPCYQLYRKGLRLRKHYVDWSIQQELDNLKTVKENYIKDGWQVSERNITIDGIQAYELKYHNDKREQRDIAFEKNGDVYCLNFIASPDDMSKYYDIIIGSMKIT